MVPEQSAGSAKAAETALRQPVEVSDRAEGLEVQTKCLKSRMDEVDKVRDDAIIFANGKSRDARLLESRISLLKDELDVLKRKKSTGCNMKIVGRKDADVKYGVNNLGDRLRQDIFDSYSVSAIVSIKCY